MFSEGKALAIYLVGACDADKCGGVNALDNRHKRGVLTHCKGYRQNGFRVSGVATVCHEHSCCTSYLVADSKVHFLILIGYDLCGKRLVASDKYTLDNHRADPGGNYTEESENKILDNEQTHQNRDRIYNEYYGRAFPLFYILTEDKGDNVNTARRSTAEEGKSAARTDTNTTEQRADDQGDIRMGRGCKMEHTVKHVR